MKESDIRPDNLKDAQTQCIEYDINFLQSNAENFIDVDCPACNTEQSTSLFNKNGFFYNKCPGCNMLYMSPRPTEEILAEFYANSPNYKYFNDFIFPASKEARRTKIFIPRVEKVIYYCEKYGVDRNKILEIGAAHGIFCEEMVINNAFSEVVGIEASDSLYEQASQMGFRIYNGILEELEINERFNVVALFEVIEHIANPQKFLDKVFLLVEENGLLIMSFPNYDGFDIATLGTHSDSIDHEHLNYFNEKAIRLILENSGFSPLIIETPGELDVELVRKKVLSGEFEGNGFLNKVCVDDFDSTGRAFQDFLKANRLSSSMLIVAIKR
ncbi:MAG TPA: class I SAM-dependent methyltransferase [Methanosarcina sp.]|nr:class I SAM-dependent methyltransferase [Methanosarcina sp.]